MGNVQCVLGHADDGSDSGGTMFPFCLSNWRHALHHAPWAPDPYAPRPAAAPAAAVGGGWFGTHRPAAAEVPPAAPLLHRPHEEVFDEDTGLWRLGDGTGVAPSEGAAAAAGGGGGRGAGAGAGARVVDEWRCPRCAKPFRLASEMYAHHGLAKCSGIRTKAARAS